MEVKELQYITIGDEYAKSLGYEEVVGSMAIIDSVLKALVGVTVISGNPAMIGKQLDIHKGDALLLQEEAPEKLYAIADFINGVVYYSKDKEFVNRCTRYIGMNQTQVFNDFDYMYQLMDELHRRYAFKRAPSLFGYGETVEKMDWVAFPLDDESCGVTKGFRDMYQSEQMSAGERAKRSIEVEAESKKKVQGLTDSFKSQLTAHLPIEDGTVRIDWNPDDVAADTWDAQNPYTDEDPYAY